MPAKSAKLHVFCIVDAVRNTDTIISSLDRYIAAISVA